MQRTCIAHLEADDEHMQFLRDALRVSDMFVGRTAHGEALVARLDRELNSTDAWNEAEALVRSLLGALNAFANLIGPVSVKAPVSAVDDSGSGETIGATLGFKLRIKSEEGKRRLLELTPDGQDTLATRIVRIAREQRDVARALALLHDRDPSWSDVYLLMEIVEVSLRREGAVAGKDWTAIMAEAWLPSNTVTAMKRNAGYHRHAKQFDPPSPMMPLSDAQRHCKVVVRRWLEKLTA